MSENEVQSIQNHGNLVALFDTQALRRRGFALVLEDWLKAHALELLECHTPSDLQQDEPKLLQYRMALFCIGGGGLRKEHLDAIDIISSANSEVAHVIIADNHGPNDIVTSFKSGARGFIDTGLPPVEVKKTLSFILNGGSFFPPSAILTVAQDQVRDATGVDDRDGNGSNGLTRRQRDVLRGVGAGKSNKVIARELSMQESTVKVHVRQILRKLGASNRTQAALLAATVCGPDQTSAVWPVGVDEASASPPPADLADVTAEGCHECGEPDMLPERHHTPVVLIRSRAGGRDVVELRRD